MAASAVGVFKSQLGFPLVVSTKRTIVRAPVKNLPRTAETIERGALVSGSRPQEAVESGENVGAIHDILIRVKGNDAIDFRTAS